MEAFDAARERRGDRYEMLQARDFVAGVMRNARWRERERLRGADDPNGTSAPRDRSACYTRARLTCRPREAGPGPAGTGEASAAAAFHLPARAPLPGAAGRRLGLPRWP